MKRFLFALWVLTLAACARPVAPEGGPKDTTPPVVVPAKSTPNYSTRFKERVIKLSFDEWVTLQDVGTQVLISPPLVKRPEVTLKGKTVTVRFNEAEVLRPNTTYTINFGTAVKDLHESNPAKDLRFVFSTGDQIDSLSLAGLVLDAFSGNALENIAVLLYDNPDDSIVRKERPYYLARTDKNGQYTIPNVRAGSFKGVAIEDANQNLKWDGDNERIGFLNELIVLSDSNKTLPDIKIYKQRPALRLATQSSGRYGLMQLSFTAPVDSLMLQPDLPNLKWLSMRFPDSILLWYDLPATTAWKLVAGKDTVSVKALVREDFMAKNRVDFGDEQIAPAVSTDRRGSRPAAAVEPAAAPGAPATVRPARLITVNLNKPVLLPFNNPVATVDTSRWVLTSDTMPRRNFSVTPDSADPRALQLRTDWASGKSYQLQLLPGAVTDFYGTANTDTLRRNFTVPQEKQLGTLGLSLEGLLTGQHYVLQLFNANVKEEERFFTADSTREHFVFARLQPVVYSVILIEDRNGNRRWDSGDYFAHTQPEPVFSRKLEPLRADWEVEAILDAATLPVQRKK